MLTNNCLIFGQPILGRGTEANSTQRPGLGDVGILKNVCPELKLNV
jgi:hypothetical protein